ncbi:hypothetical protein JCM1840_004148 [Sporobolomyces johnsonii]
MAPYLSMLPVRRDKRPLSGLPRPASLASSASSNIPPISPSSSSAPPPQCLPSHRQASTPSDAEASRLDFDSLLDDDDALLNDEECPSFLADQSAWTLGGRTPSKSKGKGVVGDLMDFSDSVEEEAEVVLAKVGGENAAEALADEAEEATRAPAPSTSATTQPSSSPVPSPIPRQSTPDQKREIPSPQYQDPQNEETSTCSAPFRHRSSLATLPRLQPPPPVVELSIVQEVDEPALPISEAEAAAPLAAKTSAAAEIAAPPRAGRARPSLAPLPQPANVPLPDEPVTSSVASDAIPLPPRLAPPAPPAAPVPAARKGPRPSAVVARPAHILPKDHPAHPRKSLAVGAGIAGKENKSGSEKPVKKLEEQKQAEMEKVEAEKAPVEKVQVKKALRGDKPAPAATKDAVKPVAFVAKPRPSTLKSSISRSTATAPKPSNVPSTPLPAVTSASTAPSAQSAPATVSAPAEAPAVPFPVAAEPPSFRPASPSPPLSPAADLDLPVFVFDADSSLPAMGAPLDCVGIAGTSTPARTKVDQRPLDDADAEVSATARGPTPPAPTQSDTAQPIRTKARRTTLAASAFEPVLEMTEEDMQVAVPAAQDKLIKQEDALGGPPSLPTTQLGEAPISRRRPSRVSLAPGDAFPSSMSQKEIASSSVAVSKESTATAAAKRPRSSAVRVSLVPPAQNHPAPAHAPDFAASSTSASLSCSQRRASRISLAPPSQPATTAVETTEPPLAQLPPSLSDSKSRRASRVPTVDPILVTTAPASSPAPPAPPAVADSARSVICLTSAIVSSTDAPLPPKSAATASGNASASLTLPTTFSFATSSSDREAERKRRAEERERREKAAEELLREKKRKREGGSAWGGKAKEQAKVSRLLVPLFNQHKILTASLFQRPKLATSLPASSAAQPALRASASSSTKPLASSVPASTTAAPRQPRSRQPLLSSSAGAPKHRPRRSVVDEHTSEQDVVQVDVDPPAPAPIPSTESAVGQAEEDLAELSASSIPLTREALEANREVVGPKVDLRRRVSRFLEGIEEDYEEPVNFGGAEEGEDGIVVEQAQGTPAGETVTPSEVEPALAPAPVPPPSPRASVAMEVKEAQPAPRHPLGPADANRPQSRTASAAAPPVKKAPITTAKPFTFAAPRPPRSAAPPSTASPMFVERLSVWKARESATTGASSRPQKVRKPPFATTRDDAGAPPAKKAKLASTSAASSTAPTAVTEPSTKARSAPARSTAAAPARGSVAEAMEKRMKEKLAWSERQKQREDEVRKAKERMRMTEAEQERLKLKQLRESLAASRAPVAKAGPQVVRTGRI